jgi:hypothetical protein
MRVVDCVQGNDWVQFASHSHGLFCDASNLCVGIVSGNHRQNGKLPGGNVPGSDGNMHGSWSVFLIRSIVSCQDERHPRELVEAAIGVRLMNRYRRLASTGLLAV